jgi:hypothetical protein
MKTLRAATSILPFQLSSLLLISTLAVGGCGGTTADTVSGTAALTDFSAVIGSTSVMTIEGLYGTACIERSGSWVIPMNGYVPAAGEHALTVVTGDVGCTLSITQAKVGSPRGYQLHKAVGPIPLRSSYAWQGTAFLLNGSGAPQFYANFRAPDLSFMGNFLVEMTLADTVNETSLGMTAVYAAVNGGGGVNPVPPPNATISLDGLTVAVDLQNVVKSATGSIVLTQGTTAAASFVLDSSSMPSAPSYSLVDSAFKAGAQVPMLGATVDIPAAALGLIGLNLTTPRQVNVMVAATRSGVSSYQVFEITFHVPNKT